MLVVKTPDDGGLPLPTDTVDSRRQYGSDKEDTMSAELQCCFTALGLRRGQSILARDVPVPIITVFY